MIEKNWAEHIIELCDNGEEEKALKIISEITTHIKSNSSNQIFKNGFRVLSARKLPHIIKISLLRNTHTFKNEIEDWSILLYNTYDALIADDKDPEKMLRGLFDESFSKSFQKNVEKCFSEPLKVYKIEAGSSIKEIDDFFKKFEI